MLKGVSYRIYFVSITKIEDWKKCAFINMMLFFLTGQGVNISVDLLSWAVTLLLSYHVRNNNDISWTLLKYCELIFNDSCSQCPLLIATQLNERTVIWGEDNHHQEGNRVRGSQTESYAVMLTIMMSCANLQRITVCVKSADRLLRFHMSLNCGVSVSLFVIIRIDRVQQKYFFMSILVSVKCVSICTW